MQNNSALKRLTKAVDKVSRSAQLRRRFDKEHPKQARERFRNHQLWLANRLETRLHHYREHIKKHGKRDKGANRYISEMESRIKWLRNGVQIRARVIVGDDAQPVTMALTRNDVANQGDGLKYAVEDSHYAHTRESTNRIVMSHSKSAPNVRIVNSTGLHEIYNIWAYCQEATARQGYTIGNLSALHNPRLVWLGHELHNCLQVERYYHQHAGQSMVTHLRGFKFYLPVFHSEQHSAQSTWKKLRDMDLSRLVHFYLYHAKHTSLTLEPDIEIRLNH